MSAQLPKAPVNEVEAAWRFLLANWIIIGAMGAGLGVILFATNLSIEASGLVVAVGYVGLYAGFAGADARSPLRRDPQLAFVLGGTAQIVLITAIMAPLTSMVAAMDFPLRDPTLFAVDRAAGLHLTNYAALIDAHPALTRWLNAAYVMIRWPFFAIPMILMILAARQRYRRIEEFTFAFGAVLAATTIISALLLPLGGSRQAALALGGIATLPSFHAASAALYAWALWPLRRLRPLVVLICGVMLAATPANGSHYFVDLFAGLMVASAAIVAARAIGRFLLRRQAGGVAAKAAVAAGRSAPMPVGALAD